MKRFVNFYRFMCNKGKRRWKKVILSLKIGEMLSFLIPYFITKPPYVNGVPVVEPDLIGEVISVEEDWLLIDGKVYVDIRDAEIIDENKVRLGLKNIEEGDLVRVWITESELIGTTPALGTAVFVQRDNKGQREGKKE
jgi:hypothetical protein